MIAIAIGRVVYLRGLTFKVFDTVAEARAWAAQMNARG